MPFRQWNVEFSSSLRNRTGKFYIGRDIIADQRDLIRRVYYWRVALAAPPQPRLAALLDRGVSVELKLRKHAFFHGKPGHGRSRRTLHLDPFTVCLLNASRKDAVLVHDLGPITHPQLFDAQVYSLYDQAFKVIVAAEPKLIFVSETSRSQFVSHYGAVEDMRVIYPPLRDDFGRTEMIPVAGLGRFLLTVGSIGRRKNQARCITAFAASGLAERGYNYVLCGAREPGAVEVEELAAATAGVRLLPYVSDAQLAWLYAHAAGFVLVSLLEGFGIPLAEAIAAGLVPLVTSDSVLEEVAGEGALSADAGDEAAIAYGMRRLLDMPLTERAARRSQLSQAIGRFGRAKFTREWRDLLQDQSPE